MVLSLAPSCAATLPACCFAHPGFGTLVYPTFSEMGGLCIRKTKRPRKLDANETLKGPLGPTMKIIKPWE